MLIIQPISDLKDRAAWEDLWRGYNADMSYADLKKNLEYLWQRLNDPASSIKGLFVLEDGFPIGFAHYVIQERTSGPKPECYIEDLYVTPEKRGLGAGSLMLQWFKTEIDIRRWKKVTLKTRLANVRAQKLYDKLCAQRSQSIHYDVCLSELKP